MSIARGTLAALLLLSACDAASEDRAVASAPMDGPAPTPAVGEVMVDEDAKEASISDDDGAPTPQRMVIRNARVLLRADDPDAVAAIATRLAEQAGGFVEASDTQGVGEQISRVDASLRVPSDRFEAVLTQLREQGELLQETVSGEDVTEQHADIDARLRSQRVLEERLLTILGKVESVEDALAVEAQLVQVRTTIERLEGSLRSMDNRVSMATIALVVEAPVQVNPVPAETVASRLDRAVDDAGRLFVGGVAGLIRALGALLPLGLVFGPLGFVGHRWWRRRRSQLALMAAARSHHDHPQG